MRWKLNELPEYWVQISLGDIAIATSGVGFPVEYQGLKSGDLPFFKVGDVSRAYLNNRGNLTIADHYVSNETALRLRGKPIQPGSTVFAKIGEALKLNRRAYVHSPCLIDNNVMAVKAFDSQLDRYVYFFLMATDFSEASRATTVPSLRKGDIESLEFPLPPLNEQKRIAEKLDSLLARVDSCHSHLERVLEILARFRQSVLAAATSGRLTEDWREEKGVNQEWENYSLGDVLTDIRYGTSKKSVYELKNGLPVLRIPNVVNGKIDASDLKFSRFDKKEIETLSLKTDDILLIRSNGSIELVGKVAIVDEEFEGFLYAGYLIRLRLDTTKVNPRYISRYLSSPPIRRHIEQTARSTSGVNNINAEELKAISLDLPSLEEQAEIVRRVEKLFAYAEHLEARYYSGSDRVGQLTPSLLAKAFRGELVEQDPNDEPASVLLERMREARANAPKETKTIRRRSEMKSKKTLQDGKRISVVEVLKDSGKEMSSEQLFTAAGYPSDATPELVEAFFVDVRDAIKNKQVARRRRGTTDWFTLS